MGQAIISPKGKIWAWWRDTHSHNVEKKDVTISLTDDQGTRVLLGYTLEKAFLTGILPPSLDTASAVNTVEKISFSVESFEINVEGDGE